MFELSDKIKRNDYFKQANIQPYTTTIIFNLGEISEQMISLNSPEEKKFVEIIKKIDSAYQKFLEAFEKARVELQRQK